MNEINDQERLAWTSASNASYDNACPGRHLCQQSVGLAQNLGLLPEDEETEDATLGRRVHAALAVGKTDGLAGKEIDLYDSCKKIESGLITQAFGAVDPAKATGLREKRLWIKFGQYLHSGQPDVVHRKGTRALIVEYKCLAGDVPHSAKNLQLRDQAVLVWSNTSMLQDLWVAVVQPFHTHSPEVCVYAKNEIQQARLLLEMRVKQSNNPDSPRQAGVAQCKYCRGKTICAEYNKFAAGQLPVAASLSDVPCVSWNAEQWGIFLERKHVAQKWLENTYKLALELAAKQPELFPNYELTPGNMVEKIIDPQGVFDRFAKLGGTLDEFLKCISVYKTRLEPLVRTHTNTKGKELKEAMEALLKGLTEVSQNSPSLQPKKAS